MVKTKRAGPRPRTRSFGTKPLETRLYHLWCHTSRFGIKNQWAGDNSDPHNYYRRVNLLKFTYGNRIPSSTAELTTGQAKQPHTSSLRGRQGQTRLRQGLRTGRQLAQVAEQARYGVNKSSVSYTFSYLASNPFIWSKTTVGYLYSSAQSKVRKSLSRASHVKKVIWLRAHEYFKDKIRCLLHHFWVCISFYYHLIFRVNRSPGLP